MTDKQPDDIQNMDFETAFFALQDNVTKLENEDLPLEKSLALFERGQLLAKRCEQLLEAAELKIRTLSMEPNQNNETLEVEQ